ncbi:mechanosensitive ion channel family protein [Rosettibacter firmus]|uniref:mechanosensitive ion channel family protein n=1 Tax=Rosettibacter firmus TaxID=3111522 RepID=UPI00336BE8EB
MKSKNIQLIVLAIIFCLTGTLIITDTFLVTKSDYKIYPVDYVFMVVINILFWYSFAYLFNYAINYFIWGKIFKITVGKINLEWIKEIVSSLIYTVATAILIKNIFWIQLNLFWFIVYLLLFLVIIALRPKLLSVFPKEAFARVKPFNVGDWISIKNRDGNVLLLGKVQNISRGFVLMKNENNNLVFIPMSFFANSIIENYTSDNDYSKFSTKICIDHSVPVERVKRILLSALEQIFQEYKITDAPEPQVLINDVNENGIVYELIYWIKQWTEVNPKEFNDVILNTSLKNLYYAGIYPAYRKSDIYIGNYQYKYYNVNSVEDRKKILKNIDLFSLLKEDELNSIATNVYIRTFRKNDVIIEEGKEGDSMFILVEGLLNVFVKNNEGLDVYVGNISAGDFFGEMSLFTGEPRSATIRARTDCLIFEIDKEIISPIIHNRNQLVEEFGRVIAERQAINIDRIAASQIHEKSLIREIVDRIKRFFNL